MENPSIDDLKQAYERYMENTEAAVLEKPDVYEEIKRILVSVTCGRVDIDEYEDIVKRLLVLIEKMGEKTLFYTYYYEHIHPEKLGRVKYFRFICKDLLFQIGEFKDWRVRHRCLNIVK